MAVPLYVAYVTQGQQSAQHTDGRFIAINLLTSHKFAEEKSCRRLRLRAFSVISDSKNVEIFSRLKTEDANEIHECKK